MTPDQVQGVRSRLDQVLEQEEVLAGSGANCAKRCQSFWSRFRSSVVDNFTPSLVLLCFFGVRCLNLLTWARREKL